MRDRQGEREGRSLAEARAFDPDPPAHRLYQRPRDSQPHPRAAASFAPRARLLDAVEPLEDALQIVADDPRPGVRYLEGNFVDAGLGIHHDPSPSRRMP